MCQILLLPSAVHTAVCRPNGMVISTVLAGVCGVDPIITLAIRIFNMTGDTM